MSPDKNNILLAFYGDDFTGSTDALEFLTRAGARTALFIEPPTADQLKKYPGLNAFGVAGKTRAMAPADMEQTLLPAFEKLQQTGARHVHYKVCSTFDSSPTIGSIGKAIDTGVAVFKTTCVPLLVAAPVLGRYCLYGNLFARMGIGSNGKIYRLENLPARQAPFHEPSPGNTG
jgi:3-oxoisoapionate kinase